MSHALKNKFAAQVNWQPSATMTTLRQRAHIMHQIRQFFISRDVLEVETPLMCHSSVSDPYIQSIPVTFQPKPQEEQRFYLQTSPEYAMKRLLAAGSGAIFQLCKSFRQSEVGRHHNPEFTMLEWYRPGFDHHQLMDEMDELLQHVLASHPAERMTYATLFQRYLDIDVHQASIADLMACVRKHLHHFEGELQTKDAWLDLLMTHIIEPQLGLHKPTFVYDFPASQAALARLIPGNPPLAARFEVYIRGMEIANGFFELQDANEQRKRFEENNVARTQLGLPTMSLDEYFLAALEHGLPDCAGVALGIDRLMMLATKAESIAEVLSFDISIA